MTCASRASSTREFGITYPRRAAGQRAARRRARSGAGRSRRRRRPTALDTEVSIEQMVHDDADVDVGDVMRFDIGGRVAARARDEHPQGHLGRGAERRLRVRAAAGAGRRARAAHVRRVPRRSATDAGGARRAPARSGRRRSRTSRSIDVRDVLASIREVIDNVTLGVTVVGARDARRRRADSRRRRGDDEVPAALRGGDLPHARRQHARARVDGGDRVRPARRCWPACWRRRAPSACPGRWPRWLFDIEWRPAPGLLAAGVVITAVVVGARGPGGQRRRAHPEAAGDAAARVAADVGRGCSQCHGLVPSA